MSDQENAAFRLSDRILKALELALEQDDVKIAEILTSALDMSMTRNAGGGDFVERRDYSPEMEAAMEKLHTLQEKAKSA